MAKIFARLRDDGGSLAIDVGRIQLRDDEEAPLEPFGLKKFFLRYQSVLGRRIILGEISDDRGTLADAEVAIDQKRYLLPGIQNRIFRCLGFAGARKNRARLVRQAQFVKRPVGSERTRRADAPENQLVAHHHVSTERRRSSSCVQPSLL